MYIYWQAFTFRNVSSLSILKSLTSDSENIQYYKCIDVAIPREHK